VVLLAIFAFTGYVLALGPYFKTGLTGPSRIIEWVPMPGRLWMIVPGIRWPARFYFVAWLGAAILAGVGVNTLLTRVHAEKRNIVAAIVFVVMVAEYWPAQWLASESREVSSPIEMSDAYGFLATEKDSGAVIEVPVPRNDAIDQELRGMYVYGASGHLRRITSIIGARKLPVMDSVESAGRLLPDVGAREFLAEHGVTRIVLHKLIGDTAANARLMLSMRAAGYEPLFAGREGIVYPIQPLRPLKPTASAASSNSIFND
jgi:hypothetical protein